MHCGHARTSSWQRPQHSAPLATGTRPARLLERYLRARRCSGTMVAERSVDSTRHAVSPAASAAPPMIAAAAEPRDVMGGGGQLRQHVDGRRMQG